MYKWTLLLVLSLFAPLGFAHEVQPEGLVNIQAFASTEAQTDTMHAVVAVEAENRDPAVLAKSINKKMAWALETAKSFSAVKVKGGQYTTHQMYNKRIFKAWRGSQTITLESKNSTELGKLVAVLQKKLLIKSIRYEVSKEKLGGIKKQLTQQAIINFNEQANLITEGFNKNKYVIHQINISTNNQPRPIHYSKARVSSTSMMAESASPANLRQNTSTVRVQINGSIRLIK